MAVITPKLVHHTIGKHMLADGFDVVCDLEKSKGAWLHDARSGKKFLDMFSFFASLPLGFNHPDLTNKTFQKKLARAAINKVTNSDIYTVEMAECVAAFDSYAIPAYLPYLFLVDGGTLGVENALKAAFDWKVKKNFAKGVKKEKGHQVIHFRNSFHGRSGYTLSLTNTADPRKHQYFPKFDWPRIDPPVLSFPITKDVLKKVQSAEEEAIAQIQRAIERDPDDIAALIIEPIQAEGGDNHFRPEFLQALRRICHEHEMMLVFDEVQTGFGLTGKFWAHEHWDVRPDFLAFGKKSQICGMLCGKRIEEVEKNVFVEASRLNSTFGGNIVDMVRVTKILEVIHRDRLLENAASVGLYLLERLRALEKMSDMISNARGLGLMCAIDFPTPEIRNRVQQSCYDKGMIILACGTVSLRFRPTLTVTEKEIDMALDILSQAIGEKM